MIGALSSLLVISLAVPSHEQSTPLSPCPNVFMYEPPGSEPGRWYGVINLSTDSTLHSLWLNIVLDSKADILGNWVGDVTTTDNIDFKVENTKMKIHPGPAQAVRFFVQYNPLNKAPKLHTIRLNGREICNANTRLPAQERPDTDRPERPNRVETTARPVSRPSSSDSRPSNQDSRPDRRPDSSRPEDSRPVIKPEDRPITKPVYGRPSGDGPVYTPTEPPVGQSNVNPYSINGEQVPSQSVGTQTGGRPSRPDTYQQVTTARPMRTTTTRRRDEDDFDQGSDSGSQVQSQSGGSQTGSRPSIPVTYQQVTTSPPIRTTTNRRREEDNFNQGSDSGSQVQSHSTLNEGRPSRPDSYEQVTTAKSIRTTTNRRRDEDNFDQGSDSGSRVQSQGTQNGGRPSRPDTYQQVSTARPIRTTTNRRQEEDDFDQGSDSGSRVQSQGTQNGGRPSRPDTYQQVSTARPIRTTTNRRQEEDDFDQGSDSGNRVQSHGTQNGGRPSRPETYQQVTTARPIRTTTNRRQEEDDFDQESDSGGQVQSLGFGTQNGDSPSRLDTYQQVTTSRPLRTTTRKREEVAFDQPSDSRPDLDDYFTGGQPTFIVPSNSGNVNTGSSNANTHLFNNNPQPECGKVVRNNPNPLVVNGKPTLEGQWPWQIALYQTQTVDNKYICGGTLVSLRYVITAAHCVTRKGSSRVVNKNTLTVYLGKHNLRTSVEGVQIRLVGEITVHPQYNASSFSRDLSILKLREPVSITDWVRPCCLWPENEEDLSSVIGKKGSVVGWGFDNTGVATEELTLVEMPVVDQETCIRSYSEFFARFTSEYTYCAGYRDGTSVCNGDSGGGMVFSLQHTWHLRGLVSLSVARQNEYRCDPTHYVVFTDLAKFLPWIRENTDV